jgi:serine/threonine protein kinase/Tfp pilus assembly protein PilF
MKPAEPLRPPLASVSARSRRGAAPDKEPGAEIENLWEQGDPAAALSAWCRHPEWRVPKRVALDLAYEEYCQLVEAGEPPDPNEFCARFPAFQSSVRRLLQVHQFAAEFSHQLGHQEPESWPAAGEEFLGFALLRELGRGAFARVFLATEPALGDRLVAVKISRHGTTEAQTLGRFNHPNIVPVHSVQVDESSGLTTVCMPYLGSATLCDVFDRALAGPVMPSAAQVILDAAENPLAPSAPVGDQSRPSTLLRKGTYIDGVSHIAAQLADALASMHALGICHRDLKPSNVLLTPDGRPMLLDFNCSGAQQAVDAQFGGTLPYMAPEQLRAIGPHGQADPSGVDGRADVFSLGVIVYELLTARSPFGPIPLKISFRELRQLLLERQQCGLRPVRELNPRVDRVRARLIERCLAYDAKDRPQSAAEVAAVLRQSLSRPRRAARWVALRWWKVLAAAVLGVAVSFAAGHALMPHGSYSARHVDQGRDAYSHGRYGEAILHYNQALEAEPSAAETLFLRGRAHQQFGHFDLALADFERSDDLAPDGRTKACMGYCANRLHQHTQAMHHYRQAIAAGYAPAAVFNNLGFSYLQARQLDPAEEPLNRAVSLDDHLQAAFHNRAVLDGLRAARTPHAIPKQGIDDIRKARDLGPVTAELTYNTARLYAVAAKQDRCWVQPALGYLEEAIAQGQDPKDAKNSDFRVFGDFFGGGVGGLFGLAWAGPLHGLPTLPRQPEAAADYQRYLALLAKPAPQQPAPAAVHLIDPLPD